MKKLVLLAILFASCTTATPTTDRHPLDAPAQYVVTDGTTSAIIIDGPEGFDTIAKRDGAVLMSGTNVWVYALTQQEQPEGDCPCVMKAFNEGTDPEGCSTQIPKPQATLSRVGDARTITPFTLAASPTSESSFAFALEGVLEGKALLSYCASYYECGAAHPGSACESAALDLATGELNPVASLAVKADIDAARAALNAHGAELDADAELQVANVRVSFSGSAAYTEALVMASACYACTFGDWGAYTVSTWQKVSPNEELPAPVAAYFKAAPSGTAPIWSPISEESRNVVEQAFAR
ncbi:MAG: hypothetical protein R3E66_19330 [bacterium]